MPSSDLPPSPPQPAPPAFRPKRLGKHDLEVRVNPTMREMPAAMRDQLVGRERDLVTRFDLSNPRNLRRWRHYLAGSVLVLPLLTWLLTGIAWRYILIELLVAAAYATAMAFLRMRGAASGFLLMGAGALTMALTGHGYMLGSVIGIISLFVHFMLGLALGVSEGMTTEGE